MNFSQQTDGSDDIADSAGDVGEEVRLADLDLPRLRSSWLSVAGRVSSSSADAAGAKVCLD